MFVPRISRPEEGNPNWPLPPDYASLTAPGQRQARVAACRQWMVQDTPAREGEALCECVDFFDHYYLWPDEPDDFNPLFYDAIPMDTPPFHYDLYKLWGSEKTTATVAPRGGAKSFSLRKRVMLQLLTRPAYSFVYATSAHHLAENTGDAIRQQLYYNDRIQDDWRPELEFEGSIQPGRGNRAKGVLHFFLNNGSQLQCLSASSRQRGIRPRRYILDDPEYDETASTSMGDLRAGVERLLFSIILPSVMRPDTGVDWIGTFVSTRHYLWHAMQTTLGPRGRRAVDPRFDSWARMIVTGAKEDPTSKRMISCWPAMWPVTIAEKLTRAETDPRALRLESLEEMEKRMGRRSFLAEIMQQPFAGADDSFFSFDPSNTDKYGWWLTNVRDPEALATAPWSSDATMNWRHNGETRTAPLKEFLARSRVFITLDTSYTAKSDSDSKVCTCMALTAENDLFVLDLFSGICHEPRLVEESLKMADRWHASTLHPEIVQRQISLYVSLDQAVRTRATDRMGLLWCPAIRKITPGGTAKEAKIAVLQPRFEFGLIKLPLDRRFDHPWRRLFDQIEGFNPEAANGGLSKDDELDTVSMVQFVIRGLPQKPLVPTTREVVNPLEELKKGNLTDEWGMPHALSLDLQSLSLDDFDSILAATRKDAPDGRSKV